MGRGTVNVPGKFGYDLKQLSGRIEQVAASGLKLGTTEMAAAMLAKTYDYATDTYTVNANADKPITKVNTAAVTATTTGGTRVSS